MKIVASEKEIASKAWQINGYKAQIGRQKWDKNDWFPSGMASIGSADQMRGTLKLPNSLLNRYKIK